MAGLRLSVRLSLLQRLAGAMEADVMPRQPGRCVRVPAHCVGDVLNAFLVLAGARPGARLDQSSYSRRQGVLVPWARSGFVRAICAEAEALGLRVEVVHAYEPIVMNLDRVGASESKSDMDAPLVHSIGRALGYPCGWSDAPAAGSRVFALDAKLHTTAPGAGVLIRLAAFVCAASPGKDNEVGKTTMTWAAALRGLELRFRRRKYAVAGRSGCR